MGETLNPPLTEAGLPRRLGALIYESLTVAALLFAAGFAFAPFVSPSAALSGQLVVPSAAGRAAGAVALAAVLGAYFLWCWTGGRRTLPQKTWRLAIVDACGTAPRAGRALARYTAGWLGPAAAIAVTSATHSRYGALALAIPYAWALLDPDRRFLHDRLAGTRVSRRD